MEEKIVIVTGRNEWCALRSRFHEWQQIRKIHYHKVVIVQSLIRARQARKRVDALRCRKNRIDKGIAKMRQRRRERILRLVFRCMEDVAVQAAIAKVTLEMNLKDNPTSPEVATMADKLRKPIKTPNSGIVPPSSSSNPNLELIPFLADGKVCMCILRNYFLP